MSHTAPMMYFVSWALVGACASILLAGCNIKHELGGQDISFNKTTTAEEIMETVAPRWNLVAGVCVCLVGCCVSATPCFYLLPRWLFHGENEFSFSLWPNADVSDKAIQGEAYFVVFLPVCGFAVAWATFRLSQDPVVTSCIQAFLLAGIVARMMVADAKKSTALRGTSLPDQEGAEQSQPKPPNVIASVCNLIIEDVKGAPTPPPFLGSKVEGSDAVLDGIAIAVVMEAQKDPFWMARFELAFAGAPIIGPVAETCGLPVLMGGALALATCAQLGAIGYGGTNQKKQSGADLAGLGVVARLLLKDRPKDSNPAYTAVLIGRVVYECCLQLLLQGSAVMAAGTPIIQQPALAASMALSVLTGLLKVKDLFFSVHFAIKVFGLAGTSILFFAVFRMGMAQSCSSFLWGISTGCVEVPDQLMPSM